MKVKRIIAACLIAVIMVAAVALVGCKEPDGSNGVDMTLEDVRFFGDRKNLVTWEYLYTFKYSHVGSMYIFTIDSEFSLWAVFEEEKVSKKSKPTRLYLVSNETNAQLDILGQGADIDKFISENKGVGSPVDDLT